MQVKVAVAKTNKYAVSESGDTVEIVERPRGGLSVIMVDGQGSGNAAKTTSSLVVNKAVAFLADGARDGAVARAAHDYLYALRKGKVSATLVILSVDLETRTLVISRNTNCPVLIKREDDFFCLDERVSSIGMHRKMKPSITEMAIEDGTVVVAFTDGILHAGVKQGNPFSLEKLKEIMNEHLPWEVDTLAEKILLYALELDQHRPNDDMAVMVLSICEYWENLKIRRKQVSLPF